MINLIAAVAENGVIGVGNQLPWHLSADLKRFKALTMGHTLVMGRKTFESIGKALPGRTTIVITRDSDWNQTGVSVAHSVDEALACASGEVFVAGGGEIYQQTIGRADRLFITHVKARFGGDTYFPTIDPTRFRVVERESHDDAQPHFEFVTYQRIN
jgi:dihydrofolate reductase